jgi:acyl-homoserine-lactone acylase
VIALLVATTGSALHRRANLGFLGLLAALILGLPARPASGADARSGAELARWQREAQDTEIVRDDWGIAHVHGKSDADAIFGMMYAQAEDDFNRIEMNYLTALGRRAEADGEAALLFDLRARLFVDQADLEARFAHSPGWLQVLMDAWADGLNFYLYRHPDVHPRVLTRFEPWMALSFTEGSIGGDIERVSLEGLRQLYSKPTDAAPPQARNFPSEEPPRETGGSNGIALAPANTLNHHALLLINPHTSFYFRAEQQVASDAGLDVYGAATWGQFFVYQGFNERVGWMHTTSGVDNVDFFRETLTKIRGRVYYRYGREWRPVTTVSVPIAYRAADGTLARRSFTVLRTHHGPIIQTSGANFLSIELMQKPVEALCQAFSLTKARDYASFMNAVSLRANSTNNTVFADADGDIAYLHPQFVPRRDDRFDYTQPVDGSDPATDWHGLHSLAELPQVFDPPGGWIMNTNDWPYSAAGPDSPRRENFPRYMDTVGENPRGVHATALLAGRKDFTADALNAVAYDSYLPAFAPLVPQLIAAHAALAADDPQKSALADPILALRDWDLRWSVHSIATTLAVLWGDELWIEVKPRADADKSRTIYEHIAAASAEQKLAALATVVARLRRDFGTWHVAWGALNRFQRRNDDIEPNFSDAEPSLGVGFTSSRWGSLASFGARRYPGTKRYYGSSGNSFVAIVEFGERVSARAVSIGGESGDPHSPHFDDQSARYADGALRRVYFYADELIGHVERRYHP